MRIFSVTNGEEVLDKSVSVRLPNDLIDWLAVDATSEGRNLSAHIRWLLRIAQARKIEDLRNGK